MTALAASFNRDEKEGKWVLYKVAGSQTIYKGALVMLNASGFALEGADTASMTLAGIALEDFVSSSSTAGSASTDGATGLRVQRRGVHRFAAASVTQAWVGAKVYIVDDNTVALAATTTNDVLVGKVVAIEGTTVVWVDIAPGVNV